MVSRRVIALILVLAGWVALMAIEPPATAQTIYLVIGTLWLYEA